MRTVFYFKHVLFICMKTILLPLFPKLIHAMREQGKTIQKVLFNLSIYKISHTAIPSGLNIHFYFSAAVKQNHTDCTG